MARKEVRQFVPLLLAVIALVAVAGLSVGPTLGQPVPPNSYYGVAETSERLAPEGTTIVAVANGTVQDSITVGSDGQYGSSSGDKLRVDSEIDSEVTFHVDSPDGPRAAETDPDPTGEVERLSLTFPDGAFDDTTPVATRTPTPTPTPTRSRTATPAQTATPTQTQTATPTQTSTPTLTQTQTATPTQTPMQTRTRTTETETTGSSAQPARTPAVAETDDTDDTGGRTSPAVAGSGATQTRTQPQSGGGGVVPWGLLRSGVLYVLLPVAGVYGVLKALAIYYGY